MTRLVSCGLLVVLIGSALLAAVLPRGDEVTVWRAGDAAAIAPAALSAPLPASAAEVVESDSLVVTHYVVRGDSPNPTDSTQPLLTVTTMGAPFRWLQITWDGAWSVTILWTELIVTIAVWGVALLAFFGSLQAGVGRRARMVIRATALGMGLTLTLAWLPPLIATPSYWTVFLSRSGFIEKLGVSPSEPHGYKKFVGRWIHSPPFNQIVWVFFDEPVNDRPEVVLSSGAITTLGFPVGALVGRELLWDGLGLKTPGLSRWQFALRVMRTPPSPIGFPLDTALWASACLVLMATPASITHIRRVRRIRRGECPDCGYPRKSGSVECSECGARSRTTDAQAR